MKTLYLQLESGAAGDMLAAALLELVPDPAASLARIAAVLPEGVELRTSRCTRGGIAGTLFDVSVHGRVEGDAGGGTQDASPPCDPPSVPFAHHHHHDHLDHLDHPNHLDHHDHLDHPDHHDHPDHLDHPHADLAEVRARIDALDAPERVKENVRAVYDLLAEAESKAHGRPVDQIHFHEVGSLDALADIASFCLLLDELAPDRVLASVPNAGGGTVRCAHGVLPVPAPATERLLEGLPWRGDDPATGELLTPTGAALLRRFVSAFGPMPPLRVLRAGHGLGHRDAPDRANLVRALLCEDASAGGDEVLELSCNLDDMTGEETAFAAERVLAAGALDATAVPALMKKGRPGTVFSALCREADRGAVLDAIFRHTTTLGVREARLRRTVLARREEELPAPGGGTFRRKTADAPGGARSKVGFEDAAAFARANGLSLREARARLDAR